MESLNSHVLSNLEELCCQAIREGKKIDLKDCLYDSRSSNSNHIDPPDYYCFLAGLTRLNEFSRILEIGTFMGGSISAMSKGLSENARRTAVLVTVDIDNKSEHSLKAYSDINRIQGDSLNLVTVRQVVRCFDTNIDMLFIDSEHTYWHVKRCICFYANRLRPEYLAIDDIHLNNSMERLWKELCLEFKERAFDLTEMTARNGCGFGIVHLDKKFNYGWFYSGIFLSVFDPLRKFLFSIVPETLKRLVKKLLRLIN